MFSCSVFIFPHRANRQVLTTWEGLGLGAIKAFSQHLGADMAGFRSACLAMR